jgi:hypothetical protein
MFSCCIGEMRRALPSLAAAMAQAQTPVPISAGLMRPKSVRWSLKGVGGSMCSRRRATAGVAG